MVCGISIKQNKIWCTTMLMPSLIVVHTSHKITQKCPNSGIIPKQQNMTHLQQTTIQTQNTKACKAKNCIKLKKTYKAKKHNMF